VRGSAFCKAVQVVGVVRSDAVVMKSAHGDRLSPQPVVIAQYVQPAGTHSGGQRCVYSRQDARMLKYSDIPCV
jgi:hypothetical protein